MYRISPLSVPSPSRRCVLICVVLYVPSVKIVLQLLNDCEDEGEVSNGVSGGNTGYIGTSGDNSTAATAATSATADASTSLFAAYAKQCGAAVVASYGCRSRPPGVLFAAWLLAVVHVILFPLVTFASALRVRWTHLSSRGEGGGESGEEAGEMGEAASIRRGTDGERTFLNGFKNNGFWVDRGCCTGRCCVDSLDVVANQVRGENK